MVNSKFFAWGQRIASAGVAQSLIQFLALASGVMILRLLKPADYALYSLSYTTLSMMSILADSGISAGGMAEAGKVWQDREKLGQVVATILHLRRRFALGVITIASPALLYLLHLHGATWPFAICMAVLVNAQFFIALQISAYGIAPALHQLVSQTQRLTLVQNVIRAIMVCAGLLLAPTALIAMLAAVPAQVWNAFRLKAISARLIAPDAKVDRQVQSRVLKVVARIMPGAVYYALSGQISIWLISIFGSTTTLASVGALSRLSQLLTVITAVFTVVLVPRFARLPADSPVLLRYWQVLGLAFGLCVPILAFVMLFSRQTLWILGKNYSGLVQEVRLQAVLGVLSLLVGLSFQLGSVRSIIIKPAISITLEILLQLSIIHFISFKTASGVLIFGIITAVVQFIVHTSYFVYKSCAGPQHDIR